MAYQELAKIYDVLMADVSYPQWADYLQQLLEQYHCPGRKLLDLGCGTGSITLELARRGYVMTGVDNEPEMLQQARSKDVDGLVDWQQMDITQLELVNEAGADLLFDGAIATFDTINHITEPEALQALFQLLDFQLADNAIFLFDIQTPYKLRQYLGNEIYTLHHPQVDYIWENQFDEETQICQMDITYFLRQDNGLYRRVTESNQERVYEPELLTMWLSLYGFEVLAIYGELSTEPVPEEGHRAVFVVRHKAFAEYLAEEEPAEAMDVVPQ